MDSPLDDWDERPIAVIGGGVMGEVLIAAALEHWSGDAVRLVEKRPERAEELAARHGVRVTPRLDEAVQGAGAVVLAVKPGDMSGLVAELAPLLPAGACVISVAVGLKAATYEAALPPGTPVVRVMPNTPALVGAGVAAISPGAHATARHLELAERLLSPTGLVVRVPEKQQDAIAALSGSGPAYVFYVIDALAEAGVLHGLPRDLSIQLAAHTVAGAGIMARDGDEHPAILRERVSSPGGTTVAALRELDAGRVRSAILNAVTAAVERARELA